MAQISPSPIVVQPVIMAGGTGTRLWPLSRAGYPKQFLVLTGDNRSLFQQAVAAPAGLAGAGLEVARAAIVATRSIASWCSTSCAS